MHIYICAHIYQDRAAQMAQNLSQSHNCLIGIVSYSCDHVKGLVERHVHSTRGRKGRTSQRRLSEICFPTRQSTDWAVDVGGEKRRQRRRGVLLEFFRVMLHVMKSNIKYTGREEGISWITGESIILGDKLKKSMSWRFLSWLLVSWAQLFFFSFLTVSIDKQ